MPPKASSDSAPPADQTPTAPAPATTTGVVDERYCFHALTRQEQEACRSCVSSSAGCHMQVMPNHMLTETGEISGFCFKCSGSESARVIPMSKSCFGMTAVYECVSQEHGNAYMAMVTDLGRTQACVRDVVAGLERYENKPGALTFECMHDWTSSINIRDQRAWSEGVPAKLGVYHCFMRTNAQNEREHKVFVVVSGNCMQASEELYNLWLDARDDISVAQFMECAEVLWLRHTTLRSLNRVAWRLMHALGLSSYAVIDDMEAVGPRVQMLVPTTYTVYNDMVMNTTTNKFFLTNNSTLLHSSTSGVIFDCFASEGFWVFHGARDTSTYKIFGADFEAIRDCHSFPTRTVCHHSMYPCKKSENQIVVTRTGLVEVNKTNVCIYARKEPLFTSFTFPDSNFIAELEKLGFSKNSGITNLMPIVTYCSDE